jgi:hypothetical protein
MPEHNHRQVFAHFCVKDVQGSQSTQKSCGLTRGPLISAGIDLTRHGRALPMGEDYKTC